MTFRLPIMVVGHAPRNVELLGHFLGRQGYKIALVSTLEIFEGKLESQERFGMALVDVSGFNRGIWKHCERLSGMSVPFFIFLPPHLRYMQQQSYTVGAHAVLVKPVIMDVLGRMMSQMGLEQDDE